MSESAPSRFRWLERGDGESVMLLHGLMGEMDHWESTLEALGERTFTSRVPHQPTRAYVRERMEEIFYDPTLVTPEWVESMRRIVTTRRTARRVLQVARAAKRHHVEDRLSQICVPTLLVWGKDDRITPAGFAERFHARIRGSQLVYLPNCGHAPMLERPEAFNAAVGDWLVETRARRALLDGSAHRGPLRGWGPAGRGAPDGGRP